MPVRWTALLMRVTIWLYCATRLFYGSVYFQNRRASMPESADHPPVARPEAALAQLAANLDNADWHAAKTDLEALTRAPGVLSVILTDVVALLEAKEHPLDWLNVLLAPKSQVWTRLTLIGKLGSLLLDKPVFAAFAVHLSNRAVTAHTTSFLEHDYLRNLDPRIIPLLLPLKYPSTPAPTTRDTLFAVAAQVAPRIACNPKAFDRLFERRADRRMDRAQWEQDLRMTRALEHLIGDYHVAVDLCLSLFTQASKDMLRNAFPAGTGAVLTFHHGGFASLRHVLLESVLPDAVYLTNHKKIARRLSIEDDTAGAMLDALRHVVKGGMIGISPDGLRGADGPEIDVLGGKIALRAGAALLAYEARAVTAWMAIGRRDEEFFPILRKGPQRTKGESFSAFQARFVAFYETCMNAFFTGDAQSLLYTARWQKHLAALPALNHKDVAKTGATDPVIIPD
jgi:hypothetical protein